MTSLKRPLQLFMANNLSEEQVAEFREAFTLLTKKGPVTSEGLGKVLSVLGLNPTDADLVDMVAQIDPRGKGTVDFNEFLRVMTEKTQDTGSEHQLREAFQVFDKDGKGYLTTDELRRVMTSLGERMTEEEVDDLVSQVDLNGEGKISCDEFVKIVTS